MSDQLHKDAEAIAAKMRSRGSWVAPFDEFDPPRQWVTDRACEQAATFIEDLMKQVDMQQGELDNRVSMYESLLEGQQQTMARVKELEDVMRALLSGGGVKGLPTVMEKPWTT